MRVKPVVPPLGSNFALLSHCGTLPIYTHLSGPTDMESRLLGHNLHNPRALLMYMYSKNNNNYYDKVRSQNAQNIVVRMRIHLRAR